MNFHEFKNFKILFYKFWRDLTTQERDWSKSLSPSIREVFYCSIPKQILQLKTILESLNWSYVTFYFRFIMLCSSNKE